MTSKSKAKGNAYERECIKKAQALGLSAVRAWSSNGRSLGKPEEVDIVIEGLDGQCKIRKKLPKWLYSLLVNVDFAVLRENRNRSVVVMWLNDFLRVLKQ